MARNITRRLDRLRKRRTGTDRLTQLTGDAKIALLMKSLTAEAWQKRAPSSKPYTQYALGSMQEVGPDYTRSCIESAEGLGRQLKGALEGAGRSVDFRLQGSVPANLHIRGVSDVDLLSLDTSFYTYGVAGLRIQPASAFYTDPAPRTSIGVLIGLRIEAEKILKVKFPSATIDCSGSKAISISGGSLAGPVYVVPSHWWDTGDYQACSEEHDRGVTILNKKVPTTIDNLPFLHIKLIDDRDAAVRGGLKKAIRLCKHVKSDAEEDGAKITLPSFDIAATMYYANQHALAAGHVYELGILAETQRYLDFLAQHPDEARKLWAPDGSRKVFDTDAKLAGLRALSFEMDDLLTEAAKEQAPQIGSTPSWYDSRNVLARSLIRSV